MSTSNVIDLQGKGILPDATKLPEAAGKKALMVAGGAAGLGVILSGIGAAGDVHRYAYSYLVGFCFTATIAAGAVFFVMLQHLVKAGWSVGARRQMEWIAANAWVVVPLFIPVVFFASTTHHEWWAGGEALKDELVAHKEPWLSSSYFIGRGFLYPAIWGVLGWWFSKTSSEQDATGDQSLSARMTKLAAPMMFIWGFSISFAGFDWLMSMQPHWYSTIFGVYTFAGAFGSALDALALITLGLQVSGYYKRVSTVEHRHDIGKLVWAFMIFWAYIAFAQFMLIYYANLPEETIFYRLRFVNSWFAVSLFLAVGHFLFPFAFLMSRHVKRNVYGLGFGACWLLLMHYTDMYWLIMPHRDPDGLSFDVGDLGGLLLPAGILFVLVALKAVKTNLYPLRDPRLPESLRVENL